MGRTAQTDGVKQVARAIARHAVDGAEKTVCNAPTITTVMATLRTGCGTLRDGEPDQAGNADAARERCILRKQSGQGQALSTAVGRTTPIGKVRQSLR